MHHPTDRLTHTTAFVTPVVELWLQREIAQWVDVKKVMALIVIIKAKNNACLVAQRIICTQGRQEGL